MRPPCGQSIAGYIVKSVVIVGLIEFCIQEIELLSGTSFCYAWMSVNYGSTFHDNKQSHTVTSFCLFAFKRRKLNDVSFPVADLLTFKY